MRSLALSETDLPIRARRSASGIAFAPARHLDQSALVRHDLIGSPAECTVCTNGNLAFMTMEDDKTVFLECQECMTGYLDLMAAGDTFRCEDLVSRYRPSTQAEIDHAMAS